MSLSHEDVVRIIQLLDASHFDELNLEADGVKLSLRRNGAGDSLSTSRSISNNTSGPVVSSGNLANAEAHKPAKPQQSAATLTDLVEVKAPMLGTFYGAPKPGADVFVSPGDEVTKDTVIGIIEVMKLMNSVSAGLQGVVVQTLVSDGELVEFDQVLMRIRPV